MLAVPLPLSCRSTPGGRPFSLMAGGGLPVATTSPQPLIGWPTTAVVHSGMDTKETAPTTDVVGLLPGVTWTVTELATEPFAFLALRVTR